MIKPEFKFERVNLNIFKSYHFHDKFDLEGQDQGYLFQNSSETFTVEKVF